MMIETVDNDSSVALAGLLKAHGVEEAVVSPGSRDMPLIVALNRLGAIRLHVVVDERSAAFVALGMASATGRPVALVCTSGTALLNYAPAVAEAFYRRLPLIVVSADRPLEWIDQDDSQTIRQVGALRNIVKHSYDLPSFTGTDNLRWYVNRTINDAIDLCTMSPAGPVHLNIRIDEPLNRMRFEDEAAVPRTISVVEGRNDLSTADARALGSQLASPLKVLILAGFHRPDEKITRALNKLGRLPNVAVMTEAQSNIHLSSDVASLPNIDSVLTAFSDETHSEMLPDVVITLGGAILSRMVKTWLRDGAGRVRHWHVGVSENAVDCFRCLEKRILMQPEVFFPQLASAMQPWRAECDYARRWMALRREAAEVKDRFVEDAEWSDLRAMKYVMESIPSGCNLQLSNGTAVRYAQLFPYSHIHRIDSNRGVSGIDGCTSTAVGASMAYKGMTVLVSGDMCAQYDMGALAIPDIPAGFRMIVLDNSGGGIFRFIKNTCDVPERDRFLVADVRLPLRDLARGFGLDYYEAADGMECKKCLKNFFRPSARPAILRLITPPEESARILKDYFKVKIQ